MPTVPLVIPSPSWRVLFSMSHWRGHTACQPPPVFFTAKVSTVTIRSSTCFMTTWMLMARLTSEPGETSLRLPSTESFTTCVTLI